MSPLRRQALCRIASSVVAIVIVASSASQVEAGGPYKTSDRAEIASIGKQRFLDENGSKVSRLKAVYLNDNSSQVIVEAYDRVSGRLFTWKAGITKRSERGTLYFYIEPFSRY